MPISRKPSNTLITKFIKKIRLEGMFPESWPSSNYDSLPSEENLQEKDGTSSPLPLGSRHSTGHVSRNLNFCIILPWILCLILSVCLVIAQIIHRSPRIHDTYETGFDTEFNFSNEALGLKKVRFTSDIQFDRNGSVWISQDPHGPHYVGPPSPEIDQAWDDLLLNGDRYVGLTAEEVAERGGFEFVEQDEHYGLYWTEPNSLHSLHCLNMLRQHTHLEYYTEIEDDPPAPFRITDRVHLDHCIEAIRQNLLCQFDTTPIPRPYRPESGFALSRIEQWHTCRNIEPVYDWVHSKCLELDGKCWDGEQKLAHGWPGIPE